MEVGILYFPSPTAYGYIYTEMLNNFICRNIVLFPPSKLFNYVQFTLSNFFLLRFLYLCRSFVYSRKTKSAFFTRIVNCYFNRGLFLAAYEFCLRILTNDFMNSRDIY